MHDRNHIPRRRFLKGISAASILGALAFKLGLPIGPVIAAGDSDPGFILLRKDEPLPSSVERPVAGISFEGNAGSDVTTWNEVPDVQTLSRRARVGVYRLTEPPAGYNGPTCRVAENRSGAAPRASVTYELVDPNTGLPESIIAIVAMPKGSTLVPFPLRGDAVLAGYLPRPGYEIRERDSDLHFWQEAGVTYLLMHIVYDDSSRAVPLGSGQSLASSLTRVG